ncbi:MAG: aminotransferase class III-fold pyridoxal phosphate-dependent enzyme, partial [Deltaproteobacteria bacterium]|nr:aminotransferase class III-fold pyridoxal phosphate-dependent enzyme [Deltaproteobacteria bacterium]
DLVADHLARTPKSRAQHLDYPELADWKSTLHYRKSLAALAYPIVAERTFGGHFRDIDGNEYLDLALGMGVHFLGHNPEYVNKALAERLERGYGLGPQCDLTAQVARDICKLTGHQRVSFCNTGSEAVMFGLRLARAVTGRPLVALFNGSYHGTFDGILAEEYQGRALTYSPGTRPGMVADLLILDYGSEEALEAIEKKAESLAAVLVEPVQSRKPGLQPQSFLKKLRRLTAEKGLALIFDEMITGFRIAPGGAQEYFGVKADLALYGKIIGGGLPLGVIAGSDKWLKAIDGGRDFHEGPSPEVIVYGGTFCRHPLSLRAAKAAIDYMLEAGPSLQRQAKIMTDDLAARLNFWFRSQSVPLRLANFGAQFILEGYGPWSALVNPLELDLFYLLLLKKGVYFWERRTCSLSTEHTAADLAFFEKAVKEAVSEIRAAGFAFGPDLENGAPKIFSPMNPTQKSFFATAQREGGQDAYHLTIGFSLSGQLEVEKLEIALSRLTELHESLRTGFRHMGSDLLSETRDYQPFHLIKKKVSPQTSALDLAREISQPYHLDRPPLWRAGLYERGQDYLFLLDASHLILDGTSLGYLIDDLNSLMAGQSPKRRVSLDKAAQAQEKYLQSGPRQADLAYWTEKFKDLVPLELPKEVISKSGTLAGHQKWHQLDREVLDKMKAAAKELKVTLNMFLNGLYVMTLNRFTGAERLVVGLAHNGRFVSEAQEALGFFMTTVPQDFSLKPQDDLPAFFENIKLSTLEALEHPAADQNQLTQALGFAPIATMLSYEKGAARLPNFPGLQSQAIEIPTFGTLYDYSLDIVEMDDGLKINAIHSEALSPDMAEVISQYFLSLAKRLTEDQTLSAMTVEELQSLADSSWLDKLWPAMVNLTSAPADFSIVEELEKTARRLPEKKAVVGQGQSLSYGELWAKIELVYGALTSLGLKKETGVAVLLPRIPFYVAAMFGTFKAGLCFMPFLEDTPEPRLRDMFKEAGVKVYIGLERPDWLDPEIVWLDPHCAQLDPKSPLSKDNYEFSKTPPPILEDSQLRYVLYTSGSTGQPKGVMIQKKGLENLCYWYLGKFELSQEDRLACFAPFIFDISMWDIIPTLLAGGELHFISEDDRHDGAKLWAYLKDHKITICCLLAKIAELLPGEEFPDLRILMSCGEAINMGAPRGSYLQYNTYGPTEFTVTSHVYLLDGLSPPPIGRPLNRSMGIILDKQGRLCPPGREGELVISGCQVSRGYLGRPDLTAKSFIANPYPPKDEKGQALADFLRAYRTGDRCQLTPAGDIRYLSRFDRQIKIRGQRIEPGEIELLLLNNNLVSQALVVKLVLAGRGEILWAYLAPETAPIDQIKAFLQKNLPGYMIPNGFTALKALPLTNTGKSDLKALPQPTFESTDSEPPQSQAEIHLAAAWAEVLGLPRVGRFDNFFSLGGDSVKVITVTSLLRLQGYNLEAADFYACQTLSELALHLTGDQPDPSPGPGSDPGSGPDSGPGPGQGSGNGSDGRPDFASGPLKGAAAASPIKINGEVFKAISELPWESKVAITRIYGSDLKAVLPLAPIQKAVFSQMALTGSGAFLEKVRLSLAHLDEPAFRQRLSKLISEADIFCLSFYLNEQNNSPFDLKVPTRLTEALQIIGARPPSLAEVLYQEDLSDLSFNQAQSRILAIEAQQTKLIENLSQKPLIRLALLKNPQGGYELIMAAHHLVLDAWSLGLIFERLLVDSPKKIQAGWLDYMEALAKQDPVAARRYWAQSLRQISEATELPGHKANLPSGLLQKRQSKLGPKFSQEILTAAAKLNCPPAFFLEAAWAFLAAKGARVATVSYAVIHNGRSLPLAFPDQIIGPCLLTIPRVLSPEPQASLADLIDQLKTVMAQSIPQAILPLSEIIKPSPAQNELAATNGGGPAISEAAPAGPSLGPGLLNHVFNYRPYQSWPEGLGIMGVSDTAGQDLSFPLSVVWEREGQGGDFILELVFDPNLFESEAIEALSEAYLTVIKAITENPQILLSQIPLCSPEKIKNLIETGNDLSRDYPKIKVLEAFLAMAERYPDQVALINHHSQMTYAQLAAAVSSLSEAMLDQLASSPKIESAPLPFPVVAILMGRDLAYPATLLAVSQAGAIFTTLDPLAPLERLLFQLDQCSAALLATDPLIEPGLVSKILTARPNLKGLMVDQDLLSKNTPKTTRPGVIEPGLDDPAYLFYTSGSTGRPKGVVISHRAIANHTFWLAEVSKFEPGERMGTYAAWTFDASLLEILPPLTHGGSLYLFSDQERLNAGAINKAIKKYSIKHVWFPPQFGQIYLANFPIDNLKVINMGGGAFPPPMELKDRGQCVLSNGYGPTECAVTCSFNNKGPGEWPSLLGHPAANCSMYVLDPEGRHLPPYFPGELAVGGIQVGLGYLGPDHQGAFLEDPFKDLAPASHLAQRLYRTGDLVSRVEGGYYRYLGRIDRQVKIRGRRLETAEVEKVLGRHPDVETAVVVKSEIAGSERLIGFVVSKPGRETDLSDLRIKAAALLPAWMIPDVLAPLKKVPLTSSGKVDLNSLPKVSLSPSPDLSAHGPILPISPGELSQREKVLLSALSETLYGPASGPQAPAPAINLDDDFLSLGGDSIKAILVVTLLEKKGWGLAPHYLYGTGSIRNLAAAMSPLEADQEPAPFQRPAQQPPALVEGPAQPDMDPYLSQAELDKIAALYE